MIVRRTIGLLLSIYLAASADEAAARFSDVTFAAGIRHRHYDNVPTIEMQPFMAGGAAAGDYDNDGWVDLYFTRLDGSDLLYRNLGDGTFQDVTAEAFGSGHLSNVQTNGPAWGDIDNDGDLDLYVTSLFSNRYHLFVNNGDGSFSEEAVARGAALDSPDLHFGFSATFGDYDRDGFLDLNTAEWRRQHQNPEGAPQNTRLLRNLGGSQAGYFEDTTRQAGILFDDVDARLSDADSQTFAGRFSDLDQDGWPDLAITSDHRTSRLFWNNGDGTFTDGTEAAGVGTDEFGMGSAIGDIDGDGDLDWFVTSIFGPLHLVQDGNRLYRNEGGRTFVDATDYAGVRDGAWGWGTAMFDHDNDGDLDIVETNGQSLPHLPQFGDTFEGNPMRFWENRGDGRFDEMAADQGLSDIGAGKGLLTLDYDRDGDLDVLVVNNGSSPVLYRNLDGNRNNYLMVRPVGRISTRQSIGAVITVDPDVDATGDEMVRELDAGSHYLGQSEALAHFGLGKLSDTIDRVTIRWLSGRSLTLHNVAPNQVLRPVEPIPEPNTLVAGSLALVWLWSLSGRRPLARGRRPTAAEHDQ